MIRLIWFPKARILHKHYLEGVLKIFFYYNTETELRGRKPPGDEIL